MIRADHVTRRFGRVRAVDDVSIEVPSGSSLALWGANGAGKTTLIRCVLGLLRFEGSITICGRDVRRQGKAARRLIGHVPQELGFYDELRVAEALAFFSRLKGHRPDPATLERVGLAGHERKRVRELSGGMKQRLALAIALLGDPPVLVLDEVTASLDAVGRRELTDLLHGLSGAGRTLLFASHRIDEVAALAGRVAMLERGRVTSVVTVPEFLGAVAGGSALHLVIAGPAREAAMASLRAGGFDARLNGVGVVVCVPADQKAAPFRLLAEARVRIDDFEFVTAAGTRGGGATP